MSAPILIRDDQLWPAVCAHCGEAATARRPLDYSLRDPAYRAILATGVLMGVLIASWMMLKVRPGITHELPAVVSFAGLFLATFVPVWVVASLTSRHQGTLQVPVCVDHQDKSLEKIVVESQGDGKLTIAGLSESLASTLRG